MLSEVDNLASITQGPNAGQCTSQEIFQHSVIAYILHDLPVHLWRKSSLRYSTLNSFFVRIML